MGRFASGVTIVTTVRDGVVSGMTANSFVSVSLEPQLVLVSLAHSSRMRDLLQETGRYAVSVLAEEQEPLSRHFAGLAHHAVEPVFEWRAELPLVEGALAHLCCRVVDAHPAGDHMLYVGEVEDLAYREGRPLLFYAGSYRTLGGSEAPPGAAMTTVI